MYSAVTYVVIHYRLTSLLIFPSLSFKFEDKIMEVQQQVKDEQQMREEAEQQGELLKQELEMGFT